MVDASQRAIKERGEFLIVLSGGNTPRGVYRLLRKQSADWSRWNVYFGDERCLPADDAGRNSTMAADEWLDHVQIPKNRVHPIPAELGATAAALAYAETLRHVSEFDLVLLGLGDDGHTASLFPGHDWGTSRDAPAVLAVFNAPKPPPERVSLSATRLSRTRETLFLITGDDKRDAVARWRAGENIPPRAIRPRGGVDVLIDRS
jgi:6-phosphogluconolactonase